MKQKVAIVGGGLTGLTVASVLIKKGYQVTVFEKTSELGGLAGGTDFSKEKIDKVYHHIFKSDKEVIGLIEELGLKKELSWYDSRLAQYFDGKMYAFGGAVDLLKFKPLGLIDRLRLGLVYVYLQKNNNGQSLKNKKASKWMRKWAGEKA